MRRRLVLIIGLATAALFLAAAWAGAASDLVGNIGPGQPLSGIAGRYPISHYSLDQHFDAVSASLTGGVDASGLPPTIAYFLATVIWQVTAFLASAVISLFVFAFSLDLLNGSPETGGAGALEPAAAAIRGIYQHTFGAPWMVVAITVAGCWAMWRGLVQRRYTETAGSLAVSLAYCVVALAIVSQPAATIGQVSRLTNEMSTAFLSITSRGDVARPEEAKQDIADQLHRLLILEPWSALNFGGTQHCVRVGTGSSDKDPVSVPVRPLPAGPRRQLDAGHTITTGGKTCVNNTARYASHFLPFADRSDERDAEYDAINRGDPGKLPESDRDTSYRPSVIDKPAADAMEKGGQYQRLLLALVIFVAELGVFFLLGALCLSVILAQVLVLLLACFAPVALVVGIVPGRGHDYFRGWLARLGTLLVRKAAYSLVLAVLLAVMAALQTASTGLGWFATFGLEAALAWTVFLQRKQLTGQLTGLVGSAEQEKDSHMLGRVMSLYYGSRVLTQAGRRLRNTIRPTPPPPSHGSVETPLPATTAATSSAEPAPALPPQPDPAPEPQSTGTTTSAHEGLAPAGPTAAAPSPDASPPEPPPHATGDTAPRDPAGPAGKGGGQHEPTPVPARRDRREGDAPDQPQDAKTTGEPPKPKRQPDTAPLDPSGPDETSPRSELSLLDDLRTEHAPGGDDHADQTESPPHRPSAPTRETRAADPERKGTA